MKIDHWGRAKKFIKKHAPAEGALRSWKRMVVEASWTNFSDVKKHVIRLIPGIVIPIRSPPKSFAISDLPIGEAISLVPKRIDQR